MVLGMVPDCVNIQKNKDYKCRYTHNPCVGRTFDGLEGEYDVMDKDMVRCPLYSIKPFSDEENKLIKMLGKKRELPSNIERVIEMTSRES